MNEKNQSLSVIIPVYNEEESLPSFAEELIAAVSKIPMPSEIIFVDDGSSDQSQAVIKKIAATDSRVKGVFLGRNAGQTSALSAGIQKSSGTLIACLDADGQNDPKDIERLISKLNEGYDVVSGWRKNRKDPWLNRRLPSQIANALISRVTGVYLHDYGCSLKIYKSEYLKPIRLYGEMHRFVPAFAGFLGAKITELEVNHRPRIKGKSKYGISRTLKVILDLLTVKFMDSYMGKPIYLFGGGGIIMMLLGALAAAITLYKKFALGIFVKDQPLFQVAIFFSLIGFQLLLLGLLAEILVRTYFDIKDKNSYFIRETVGF